LSKSSTTNKIFVVLAISKDTSRLPIAAYDDQKAAEDHARFINEIDNEWRANVEWMPLWSYLAADRLDGWLRDLAFLPEQIEEK
jgi:hypothetical protein